MSVLNDAFRVLVVEDDEPTRYAWSRVLSHSGFEVTAVDSVEAALAALPAGCDVLLTDQKLPDGNGAELIERAMQAGLLGTTATVLCTAYTPTQLEKGMHLGTLRKPVEHSELVSVVERGAREARLLQHLNARRGAARARLTTATAAEQARASGGLSDVLERHRDRIIAVWKQRLAAPGVGELELIDHTPQVLAEIARALKADRQQGTVHNTAVHGAQRYRIGFDVHSVVREYGLLREAIVDVAAELQWEVTVTEHELLTRYTVEAIAVSVRRFLDEHAELRRS